ncbi:TPR end-of-group domain-containing protein [Acaryochloris marina]|uniref:TPR end-of-group domain-containing protein n=1 Tax=Acaryochloris marina TaxID=155978 RepID=UPI0021C3FA18|nr:tetratricopeptide repeat protein [Acaryochloris marina]BDM82666.1 hypothetical protein AM10699_55270 [Acaryochloris marina MBIC10699]
MLYPFAPEPYISRPQAEYLVNCFGVALTQPQDHPLVFNISGMAGTGKTTLLNHLIKKFSCQAEIIEFSFRETIQGLTAEASLDLMHHLYEQVAAALRQKTDRKFSSFSKLYEQYCSTIKKLINESPNKKATTDVERTQVKQGLKQVAKALPIAASFSGLGPVATGIGALSQVATDQNIDTAVDGSIALLSGKEWLQQWLQQHNATKRDQALQQLVLNPVQRLTQAFVADLIAHADQKPIIICLDTFEKAPLEIDRWLCYYLLSQVELNKHPIRIVISGQQRLTQKEEWRKLQQDCDLIFEQILERFNGEETQAYLEEIHWTSADDIQKIIQITGGLPYYLNWIRKKFQKGEEIDLSQGNQAVSDLLFQGITQEKRIVVQLIACCRWFDRALIRKLIRQGELLDEAAISQDYDWFEWLKPQHYVQQIQGKYQFDDVARNVFQTLLQQEDEEHFRNAHLALAKHYQHRANQMIAPNSSEPARYNNPDWCEAITEYLYHLLLSEQSDRYAEFLNYFFASHYLKTNEVVTNAFVALTSEHELLSKSTQVYFDNIHSLFNSFLSEVLGLKISQLIDFVKQRSLSKTQDPERIKEMEGASKTLGDYLESELSNTLVKCSNYINQLEGLGKYTFLLYQSQVVSIPEAKNWLKRATDEANKIANITFPDFSSDIYHKLGNSYSEIKDFEEAIASYDKALEFKPDKDEVWYNRGVALGNLRRFDEAIASYDKALELKPEDPNTFYNKACCFALQINSEASIEHLKIAISLAPEHYLEMAKTDSDFDSIRDNEAFQAVLMP